MNTDKHGFGESNGGSAWPRGISRSTFCTLHSTLFIQGWAFLGLILALVAVLVGCATRPSGSHPHKNYVAEYRQMTAGASDAIRATLQALDGVQTNSSPRQAADRFSDQVHRLEVDSLKVRARSQAMLARGDSYFEQWHHHLARIKDPEVRALAEQRRPELQESFARIKQLSHQTREDFQPFRSDLRKLRNILETDPGAASSSTTSDLVETIRRKGLEVGQDLAALLEELDKTAALVKPLRTAIRN